MVHATDLDEVVKKSIAGTELADSKTELLRLA